MAIPRWLRGFRNTQRDGGGGSLMSFFDEGLPLGTANSINLVGSGVIASVVSGQAIFTIPGQIPLAISDEGTFQGNASAFNVVGAGANISVSLGVATLTVPGSTPLIDDALAISVCL